MSTERDTTRIVRSWLEQGVTALPDRVLDDVLDQLPATPQRRPFWRARRFPIMSSPLRYAIAAAAVLVVAVAGYQLLPTSNVPPGGVASPTPLVTTSPTAPAPSPSAAGTPMLPLTTDLEPGRYRVHRVLDVTFEAPAGWATCCEDPAGVIYDGDEPHFGAIFFEDFTGVTIHHEPCNWDSDSSSSPVGAQAIAEALAAQSGSGTPVPEEVTVAGLPGYHVQLVVPDDLAFEEQPDEDYTFLTCDSGQYTFWTATVGERYAQRTGQIEDVYLVDVDDRTLAFDVSSFPGISDADAAALQAMVESVEIG